MKPEERKKRIMELLEGMNKISANFHITAEFKEYEKLKNERKRLIDECDHRIVQLGKEHIGYPSKFRCSICKIIFERQ